MNRIYLGAIQFWTSFMLFQKVPKMHSAARVTAVGEGATKDESIAQHFCGIAWVSAEVTLFEL